MSGVLLVGEAIKQSAEFFTPTAFSDPGLFRVDEGEYATGDVLNDDVHKAAMVLTCLKCDVTVAQVVPLEEPGFGDL